MIQDREAAAVEQPTESLVRLFDAVVELRGDPRRLERAAEAVVAEARRRLPGCETEISMVPPPDPHEPDSEFQMIAGAGPWAEALVGGRWPLRGTVHGLALAGTDPIEVVDPAEPSRFPEILRRGGVRSGRLVPLVAGEPLPGGRMALRVLAFWSPRAEPFSEAERVVTDDLGRIATLVLAQVEAWHAAERSEGRLRLRKAIAEDVQTSLDIPEVVERAVGHQLEIAAADRVTLSTVEGDELRILFTKDRGEVEPSWQGIRIPLERAMRNPAVAGAFAERRSYRGGPFRAPVDSQLEPELSRARHTAMIPLVIRSEVTGLIVLTRRTGDHFSDDEIAELEISASVAALAFRNARLYQQAQAAAAARSAFLNLAAHELRTPFAVISGYLSLLTEGTFGPAPADWTRPLTVVRQKTAELGRLIDQILAASRAESGQTALKLEAASLAALVRAAVERVQPRVELHGGSVSLVVEEDPVVRVDTAAMAIVLRLPVDAEPPPTGRAVGPPASR
ncbi:MAG TPA: GAF domain-containing sensor histidine kinase [Candidatus Binatia bacterium]|nr:GAF domain-containing sensor histidine kinase [Candidatus Binatia bacterium]